MTINWDPVPYVGPIPINWYGLGWVLAFLVALWLVRRWAPAVGLSREHVENLALWSLAGAFAGARLYFIAQNDPSSYIREPWRILMLWEGGLAFFGGLFGAVLAASSMRHGTRSRLHARPISLRLRFQSPPRFGRVPCWLAGMDYGTPTTLPWGASTRIRAGMHPTTACPATPSSCTSSPVTC